MTKQELIRKILDAATADNMKEAEQAIDEYTKNMMPVTIAYRVANHFYGSDYPLEVDTFLRAMGRFMVDYSVT